MHRRGSNTSSLFPRLSGDRPHGATVWTFANRFTRLRGDRPEGPYVINRNKKSPRVRGDRPQLVWSRGLKGPAPPRLRG